jgi:hypothetical protein
MPGRPVFADQAEEFSAVVHALLQDEETRAVFAKDPLATLERHGIRFKDPAVAKQVDARLRDFAGQVSIDEICPPYTWAISPISVTRTQVYVRTRSVTRATSITWAVKPGEIEEVIVIDQPRVDAFMTQVALQARIAMLETKIAELERVVAMR